MLTFANMAERVLNKDGVFEVINMLSRLFLLFCFVSDVIKQ